MKKSQNRKHHIKVPLSVILTLLLFFYWVWMFYATQPATEQNTYTCSEKITNIEIKFAHHRGHDKLYIYTENGYYMLRTSWANETKSTKLSQKILSNNLNLTFIVWEHFPQYLFDLRTFDVDLHQVVNLKSNTETFWSIDEHNKHQKVERIAGVISGIFFSVFVIGIDILEFYIGGYDRYRKKKQKEKKKIKRNTGDGSQRNTGDGSLIS